jgi:hypothetical protein
MKRRCADYIAITKRASLKRSAPEKLSGESLSLGREERGHSDGAGRGSSLCRSTHHKQMFRGRDGRQTASTQFAAARKPGKTVDGRLALSDHHPKLAPKARRPARPPRSHPPPGRTRAQGEKIRMPAKTIKRWTLDEDRRLKSLIEADRSSTYVAARKLGLKAAKG